MRWRVILLGTAVLVLGLSACSSSKKEVVAPAESASVAVTDSASPSASQMPATGDDSVIQLQCPSGTVTTEATIGGHITGPLTYSLEETTTGEGAARKQISVKLSVRLPKGVALPVVVVHTTHSNDQLFSINVAAGQSGNANLPTAGYAAHTGDTIFGVALCAK